MRYWFWLFFMGPDSAALIFPAVCVVIAVVALLFVLT